MMSPGKLNADFHTVNPVWKAGASDYQVSLCHVTSIYLSSSYY